MPVAGGEVSGDVESDRNRTLTLPAGTVLAYEVRELAVDKKGMAAECVSFGTLFSVTLKGSHRAPVLIMLSCFVLLFISRKETKWKLVK